MCLCDLEFVYKIRFITIVRDVAIKEPTDDFIFVVF